MNIYLLRKSLMKAKAHMDIVGLKKVYGLNMVLSLITKR